MVVTNYLLTGMILQVGAPFTPQLQKGMTEGFWKTRLKGQ